MIRSDVPTPVDLERLPSEGVRTFLSLVLFIHLFAVCVALLSNASPAPSRLTSAIRTRLLGHYLYLTWLDVAYPYHYISDDDIDVKHSLEGELAFKDGTTAKVAVEPAGAWGLREKRFQHLAYHVAANVGLDGESLLPSMIGGSLIANSDTLATDVVLSCLRHPPQPLQGSTPAVQTAYRAQIRLIDGRPVVVNKFEEKGQVGAAVDVPPASPAREPISPKADLPDGDNRGLPLNNE